MKAFNLFACAVFALHFLSGCCIHTSQAVLSGTVDNYKGEGYLLCVFDLSDNTSVIDTLAIKPDGSFRLVTDLPQASVASLYPEYLGEDARIIEIYMVNGSESKVKITTTMDDDGHSRLIPEFYGDNKAESLYLERHKEIVWGSAFAMENAVGISFKTYQAAIKKEIDGLQNLLQNIRDLDFKEKYRRELTVLERDVPFRFIWANRNAGKKVDDDADFVKYVNTFDLNNMENINITEQIIRWKMACNPDPDESVYEVREMKWIKKMISNQEVVNAISSQIMDAELSMGGSENLKAIFEEYKRTSTDLKTIESMFPIYDRLTKLTKGAQASDFEVQDIKGNTLPFHDIIGKGKITYIDVWATWCGPCCMEIPYLKKLVEKYKQNPCIEFISISLDEDLVNWHRELDNDQPAWPQYIVPDHFNSAFAKEYNITAIPRFMVFDKTGKIITVNAGKPSDDNIGQLIESWLKD